MVLIKQPVNWCSFRQASPIRCATTQMTSCDTEGATMNINKFCRLLTVVSLCVSVGCVLLLATSWAAEESTKPTFQAPGKMVLQLGHSGPVRRAGFIEDGKKLWTVGGDNQLITWNTANWTISNTWRFELESTNLISVDTRGKLALYVNDSDKLIVYDLSANRELRQLPRKKTDESVDFVLLSGNGKIGVSLSDEEFSIWDIETGKLKHALDINVDDTKPREIMALSHDGSRLAVVLLDDSIKILDTSTGKEISLLEGHEENIRSVDMSHDGSRVLSGGDDNIAILWDANSGDELKTFEEHVHDITVVSLSADAKFALTSSEDFTSILWDTTTGKVIHVLDRHEQPVALGILSPQATQIITQGREATDENLYIWDAKTGKYATEIKQHTMPSWNVAIDRSGKWLANASKDQGVVLLWNLQTGKLERTLKLHEDDVFGAAFSADGQRMLSGSADKKACLLNPVTGETLTTLSGHDKSLREVALTANGQLAITGGDDHVAIVWDLETGATKCRLEASESGVTGVSITDDGTKALSGSDDKHAYLWDVNTGKQLFKLKGHTASVYGVALSTDGTKAVTASSDDTAIIWDATTGKKLHHLKDHSGSVLDVALTVDGKHLVTSSGDKSIRYWDVETGKCLHKIKTNDGVYGIAVEATGRFAAGAVQDDTVVLCDLADGKIAATIYALDKGTEWLVVTPDGRYDGSAGGLEIVTFQARDDGRMLKPAEYQSQCHVPGLLAEIWSGKLK
jgi:WD40 repeat protein